MQGPKEKYNANKVLEKLEAMIERGCSREIRQVYDDLSIFDWWPERLTITHMKQMRTFLREAIKLGYDGYVCFKVGASGCANGMAQFGAEKPIENGDQNNVKDDADHYRFRQPVRPRRYDKIIVSPTDRRICFSAHNS